ncbi:MAG: hypothetical protein GF390_00015 [Candidatus Pacebacteria bacterium]|nr:hypothetical protein [Candidatus Paceibacterota bacterium]
MQEDKKLTWEDLGLSLDQAELLLALDRYFPEEMVDLKEVGMLSDVRVLLKGLMDLGVSVDKQDKQALFSENQTNKIKHLLKTCISACKDRNEQSSCS